MVMHFWIASFYEMFKYKSVWGGGGLNFVCFCKCMYVCLLLKDLELSFLCVRFLN